MVHFSSSEKRVKGDLDDVGNVDNVGAYIHKSNRKVTIKNISEIYTGEGAMHGVIIRHSFVFSTFLILKTRF